MHLHNVKRRKNSEYLYHILSIESYPILHIAFLLFLYTVEVVDFSEVFHIIFEIDLQQRES